MKNRFEHEINITKHFLSELEGYLERDEAKQLEEMTERYYSAKQVSEQEIEKLNQELSEARLKVSRMAMDLGKALKKIDSDETDIHYLLRSLSNFYPFKHAFKEDPLPKGMDLTFYQTLSYEGDNKILLKFEEIKARNSIAEPDATGRP